jgi:two-component system phosphate regulon sensor histidine kinase PhoR
MGRPSFRFRVFLHGVLLLAVCSLLLPVFWLWCFPSAAGNPPAVFILIWIAWIVPVLAILAWLFMGRAASDDSGAGDGKKNDPDDRPRILPAASRDPGDHRSVFVPGRNYDQLLDRLEGPEALLNAVLFSMSEGVILLNASGRVILANRSAQTALEVREADMLGKHFLEVVRHAGLADLITRSRENDGVSHGELEFGGGQERTFSANVGALRESGGRVLGQIVVFSDITPLKRLMKMRSEFVANVSHELKTPLTAIMGYVETLQEGGMEDKKNRGVFLDKIADQSKRLHALIMDVLDLSRIETGNILTSAAPVPLEAVAEQAAETLRGKAATRRVTLRMTDLGGKKVRGDAEALLPIVANLLDNAVKFSAEGSTVEVGAREDGAGRTEIWVRDEGPGIPKEHLQRLFERFYRVDVSRSRQAGGTGLGLSIVKHLAERMGGQVRVESEEGKGSVFTVTLPSA